MEYFSLSLPTALSPKPAATPAAHGVVRDGGAISPAPHHNYIPPDINVGNQVRKRTDSPILGTLLLFISNYSKIKGRSQFMASQIERMATAASNGGGNPDGKDARNEPVA